MHDDHPMVGGRPLAEVMPAGEWPCPLRLTVAGEGRGVERHGYLFGSGGCAGCAERVRRLCSGEARAAAGGHAAGTRGGVLLFLPVEVYIDWCRGRVRFTEAVEQVPVVDVVAVDEVAGYPNGRPEYRSVWCWAHAPAPQRALAERLRCAETREEVVAESVRRVAGVRPSAER